MSTDVSAQDNNRHCCLADLICRQEDNMCIICTMLQDNWTS
ncbi:hypothetical protein PVAP13_8KG155201 [Panicum virgatum]|uniref:Uncharacterized protein n=1 Tax=Panicum virgatum TaxID=38727 RepID=A0A8T0PGC6_PANVG|nr:hypothetical protein PVAP13_8KG155201 [Panicum virgatum]